MKKINIYSLTLLIASIFTLNSCEKAEELLGKMSATIDGEAWTTVTRVVVQKDNGFIITGTAASKQVLAISTVGITEGTYELSLTTAKAQFGAVLKDDAIDSESDSYIATSGTVVITDINTSTKKISGTFTFSMTKTVLAIPEIITVAEGVFENLTYTVSSSK